MRAFIAVLILSVASAYTSPLKFSRMSTKIYENFDLNKIDIISAQEIFSEKQLREYTATYSEDYRMPLPFISDLLALIPGSGTSAPRKPRASSSVESALKSSMSLSLLQEKTADYVKGKINAGQFKNVLKAAFGDKLPSVLPEINENLPKGKKL